MASPEMKKKMPLWLVVLIVLFLAAGWIWFVVHKSAPAKAEDHTEAEG